MTANTLTPIVLGGSDAQKKKYLGWLTKEPILGSYATTEPNAGSDVAGMQCRAKKESDGSYALNGTKCWITNASYASFYVIFATVELMRHSFIEKCRKRASYTKFLTGPSFALKPQSPPRKPRAKASR